MNPIEGSARAIIVSENVQTPSVAQLLQLAVQQLGGEGAASAVEALEKLVALHERVEANRAAGEFAKAMAEFQQRCPSIPKTSTAKIATAGGSSYSYKYAELDQIASVVGPILSDLGVSYSWDSDVVGDVLKCSCTIRHSNGHTVTSTFSCPTDTKAAMSGAQKFGAALTYARRQSLIQVLGLTTCDPDDDGATQASVTKIDRNQAANIESLMSEVGADRAKFLHYMGVASIEDIPVSGFQKAVNSLQAKARKGAA
jgi:hypothetical protein